MIAHRDNPAGTFDTDPLISTRMEAMADLAFGSLTVDITRVEGGHLALLSNEALELDLNDPLQRQFGDYELLEQIGEGGMGVVYRARQRSLDREVAVKLLAAGPWASKTFIERFRLEAQNAARMQHPNIVAIYDVGSADELHFFSMRLVRGGSLAGILRRDGRLAPRHAAALVRSVAEAVDYAHRLGVLHLDLKPANVLVDEDGVPHVADFGLARRLDNSLAADNDEISGTPSYMAPEQAQVRSQKLTVATDIWGLGAILHELLTGHPPFLGATPQATLDLVRSGERMNMRSLQPDIPEDLVAIVRMCLQLDVATRYPSARALADDLGRFIEGRIVRARPLGSAQRTWRWSKRQPYLATLALLFLLSLLVGIAGVTTQWRRAEHNARDAEASATLANERLWQARVDQAADALHDGRTYDALPALAANISEREALGLDAAEDRMRFANVERSAPRLIDVFSIGAGISGVAISPDGKRIAVADGDKILRLLDAASGAEIWRTSFKGSTHFLIGQGDRYLRLNMLHFTPDGHRIAGYAYYGPPEIITPHGGDELLFDADDGHLLLPSKQQSPDFRDATFSEPDTGFAIVHTGDGRAQLMRTRDWQPVTPGISVDSSAAWLVGREAKSIAVVEKSFCRLTLLDPRTLKPQHRFDFPTSQRMTSWTADPSGRTFLIGHLDGQIESIGAADGRVERLTPSLSGRVGTVVYSADGRWFGAATDSGEVAVWDAASRTLLSPPMSMSVKPGFSRQQLVIDPARRTVFAASDWTTSLWYLPDDASPPLRLSSTFPFVTTWLPRRPSAYDAAHGLVAIDGGQGDVRLWRTRSLATLGLLAARVPPPELHIADRFVAVDGNRMRLIDAASGQPRGAEMSLPRQIGNAELGDDGATIAASAGATFFVFDANTGVPRRPPIELPNDPARWMLTPDGRSALVFFADYANGSNRQTLQRLDFMTGRMSAAQLVDPGSGYRFISGGRQLLSWEADQLTLRDAQSLATVWRTRPLSEVLTQQSAGKADPDIAIMSAHPSPDGAHLDVLTAGDAANVGASRLWHVDLRDGSIVSSHLLDESGGGRDFVYLPAENAYVVDRTDGLLWWNEKSGAKFMPSPSVGDDGDVALSPTADMMARITKDGVELTSTHTQRWLAPLLPIDLSERESLSPQVSFTADGRHVIARSRFANWLAWTITPDARSARDIERDAALSKDVSAQAKENQLPPLSAADRALLRAADPGAPDSRAHSARALLQDLPRAGELSNVAVDLSGVQNQPRFDSFQGSETQELTPGPHRFFGVDYDVHGCVAATPPAGGPSRSANVLRESATRIRLPAARVSALDVLIGASGALANPSVHPYAFVTLQYRDGGNARLPILYRRDVLPSWQPGDGSQENPWGRIAWRAVGQQIGWPTNLFAVRLVNPQPQREIADIALEAVNEPWSSPSFCAITIEPQAFSAPQGTRQ